MPPWTRRRTRRQGGATPSASSRKCRYPLVPLSREARRPVVLEGDDELEAQLMLAGLERPAESRARIVALGDDEVVALRPFGLRRKVGRSRDGEVVLGVAAPQRDVLAGGSESLRGELADRLQHPVARLAVLLAPAKQALVQQGLERVRVGIAHALRRLVVAAAREDRERTKEPLLLGSSRSYDHSIVARSVCCRGSASRPAFSRSRRSDSRSTSCSGEKTTVRAAASSSASGRLSSRRQSSVTASDSSAGESSDRARARNSSTPSSGSRLGTEYTCSPWSWSRSRLVTRSVGPAMSRSSATSDATSGMRCSALSSIRSVCFPVS